MSETLSVGVVATSRKENEHRVPIHPAHLERIDPTLRRRLRFEHGYGRRFGYPDEALARLCGGLADRATLLAESEIVLLPKPVAEDFRATREGAIVWGWPHCVQQRELTQLAIDRRFTLIAWEAMFQWSGDRRGTHVFARNNELAGYCAVLHAFELLGIDGGYGPPLQAAILGFGSVSRGAIYALRGRGVRHFDVFTQRPAHLVRDRLWGANHLQMRRGPGRPTMEAVTADGKAVPLIDTLARAEILVNGTLQDPLHPLMYFREGEEERLRDRALILDVSCDLGMGFPFARPTSFEAPTFRAGPATYYAVDHTPTYLWNAASWEISEALLPYLEAVMSGPEAWDANPTVARSIEIRRGRIQNPKILRFQKRAAEFPHEPLEG